MSELEQGDPAVEGDMSQLQASSPRRILQRMPRLLLAPLPLASGHSLATQAPAESTHRSGRKDQGLNCRRKPLSQRGLGAGEQALRVPQALVRISEVCSTVDPRGASRTESHVPQG